MTTKPLKHSIMHWRCAWTICAIIHVVSTSGSRGYPFKCPEESQRRFRAKMLCENEDMYHCLYDVNELRYVELCKTPKEYTTGRKAVYSGNMDARVCSSSHYMPFIYASNMSAECLYQRSHCNEEGQIQLHDLSSATDTACLCDFRKGYAFVTMPKAVCYCVPSEEDCSCYKKKCRDNSYMLSPDYRCVFRTSPPTRVGCQASLSKISDSEAGGKSSHTEFLKRNEIETIVKKGKWKLVASILVTGLFITCFIVTGTLLVIIFQTDEEYVPEEDGERKLPIKSEENVIQQDFNTAGMRDEKDEGIFCINCPSKTVLHLDREKLQSGMDNKPRILDICFMNLKSGLALIYIDADNDKIVKYPVPIDTRKETEANIVDIKKPNRLTKVDDRRVAIIHKKAFDIIIFNVQDMKKGKCYVADETKLQDHFIEGITALSRNELILSNKERLFIAKLDESTEDVELKPFAPSIRRFDTARRLTCITLPTNDHLSSMEKLLNKNTHEKLVFIADENDKTITCVGKKGDLIEELNLHNRGLQNVRGIAATDEYVFAATSAGVSVYTHERGKIKKENSYAMLIEYNRHVDHTRGLCIETNSKDNRIYLALTYVVKRTDAVTVFSFNPSDLKSLEYE